METLHPPRDLILAYNPTSGNGESTRVAQQIHNEGIDGFKTELLNVQDIWSGQVTLPTDVYMATLTGDEAFHGLLNEAYKLPASSRPRFLSLAFGGMSIFAKNTAGGRDFNESSTYYARRKLTELAKGTLVETNLNAGYYATDQSEAERFWWHHTSDGVSAAALRGIEYFRPTLPVILRKTASLIYAFREFDRHNHPVRVTYNGIKEEALDTTIFKRPFKEWANYSIDDGSEEACIFLVGANREKMPKGELFSRIALAFANNMIRKRFGKPPVDNNGVLSSHILHSGSEVVIENISNGTTRVVDSKLLVDTPWKKTVVTSNSIDEVLVYSQRR